MEDERCMPYTQAVISEVQRICDLVPLNVPHCTTEDTILRGYNIPKDTMIFPMLHSVHWDSKPWPEPEQFKPERFISEGKYVKKAGFVPFSLGNFTLKSIFYVCIKDYEC
jgi:cytochrome P450